MTEATYKFEHAISMLKQSIEYAEAEGDFSKVRVLAFHVEASYNADIAAERKLTANANEGAKLLHSLATGMYDVDTDEGNLLKQWQNEPDFEDEKKEVQPIIDFDNVQEIPL